MCGFPGVVVITSASHAEGLGSVPEGCLFLLHVRLASIPGRSQLRKTAWYTLSAHASIAPKNLGGRDI